MDLNEGSPYGRAPAQAGERVGGKIPPSPSANAATSPRGRGYIVFLYSSVGEDIILPPPYAVILSEAARDSASAFASRFFAEILRGAAL